MTTTTSRFAGIPYSADMTKNPLTFKHIGNNVVLPTGPPINASAGGQQRGPQRRRSLVRHAVGGVRQPGGASTGTPQPKSACSPMSIGGLKLTPMRPTFTQARDAIIAAVSALDPAECRSRSAPVSARTRGMGKGAVSAPVQLVVARRCCRRLCAVARARHDHLQLSSTDLASEFRGREPPVAPGVSRVRFGKETLFAGRQAY